MGIKFLKVSVIYFVIGVLLGMYMSMAHDYILTGVHVHINLIGWISAAAAGLIYWIFPKSGDSVLAKIHFWLHNIGLPIMMLSLALLLLGQDWAGALVPVGAIPVVISVIIFAINVISNVSVSGARR